MEALARNEPAVERARQTRYEARRRPLILKFLIKIRQHLEQIVEVIFWKIIQEDLEFRGTVVIVFFAERFDFADYIGDDGKTVGPR